MNTIILFSANYLIYIAVLYACIYVFLKHERKNNIRHIATILGSALLAWVGAHSLKNVIAHPRPDIDVALILPSDPYSFPSGHASFMFALAFAMYSFDKRAASILFVFAVLTGIARVLVGVHYWYDIVGGIVFGFLVAQIVLFLVKRLRV